MGVVAALPPLDGWLLGGRLVPLPGVRRGVGAVPVGADDTSRSVPQEAQKRAVAVTGSEHAGQWARAVMAGGADRISQAAADPPAGAPLRRCLASLT